jgi:hypothetical protein
VRAFVLSQVPNANISSTVTANKLALIWVDDHIVDRYTMGVAPLHISTPRVPNLHRPIFRRCHHPFSLAMEGDARDIASMAIEGENSVRIRRFYVIELDSVMPGGSEVTFVRRDAETVHLRVWVGDRSRANSG